MARVVTIIYLFFVMLVSGDAMLHVSCTRARDVTYFGNMTHDVTFIL